MSFIDIDTLSDARLEPYRELKDSARIRRLGAFHIEGFEVLRTAVLRGRFEIQSVLLQPKWKDRLPDVWSALEPHIPRYVVSRELMAGVAGFDVHRGLLAVGRVDSASAEDAWRAADVAPGRVLVLEDINNHDNVGGIFRSAAGFGVQAILLDERSADPLYRKSIRVSMGAALTVPYVRGPKEELRRRLSALGYQNYALTPKAQVSLRGAPLAERIALWVGSEGFGLSAESLDASDLSVGIEMAAGHDSLNAYVAASVAMFALAPR